MIRPLLLCAIVAAAPAVARAQTLVVGKAPIPGNACPDVMMATSMIDGAILFARDSISASPPKLPATCLLEAVPRPPGIHPDSVIRATIGLANAVLHARPTDAPVLAVKLVLLPRIGADAEVAATFDALIAADPARATAENYRLAVAAADRIADTTAMLRYLSTAAPKFPSTPTLTTKYAILQSIKRLRAQSDTARRAVKKDSTRWEAYATLISVFGNLGLVDSAMAYTRLALAHKSTKEQLAPSVGSVVNVLIQNAQLQSTPITWEGVIPVAAAVDSAFPLPAAKYLIALAVSQLVQLKILPIQMAMMPRAPVRGQPAQSFVEPCRAADSLSALIAMGEDRLHSGGADYAPQFAASMVKGFQNVHTRLDPTLATCH